ncbi:MAG: LLM class flavin-dependent oxidoreductase [Pseudomonadota bacterium]
MIPISILDLAPIVSGSHAGQALRNTLDLAQHAEKQGYHRYWLAEHHNMIGIASAATAVAIGYIASGTNTIRVGAGGIMLPNHAPLIIAEQFGTLEALYPGRIDLGLGRAPGTDPLTTRALRRAPESAEQFPRDVMELQMYFEEAEEKQSIRAVPGMGLHVPIWLLGSSLFSAQLAAALGRPFAFASHFAPEHLLDAIALYRRQFQPSATLQEPYVMAGLNVFAANSDEEAQHLFTSLQQQFLNLRRGTPGQLPQPIASLDTVASDAEQILVARSLRYSVVGSRETIGRGLNRFIEQVKPDEIMATAMIYDHKARLRSFEILAEVMR